MMKFADGGASRPERSLLMTDEDYSADDLIGKPPKDTVLLKKIGSWNILFSQEEQSLYIVPTDYHPEPLKLHKR